jgi:hypothetical protein
VLTFVNTNALSASTLAAQRARANIDGNRRSLAITQPSLRLHELANIGEFLFGRDGSLTARDTANQWLSQSSLPLRVAQEILRKFEPHGVTGCLLSPTHAAQIRAALDKLQAHQALLVIVPSLDDLTQFLHCEDFSNELDAHRLWFAAGDNWQAMLRALFEDHPGLPTPTQFLRLPIVAPEINDALIAATQPIFALTQKARSERARAISWKPTRAETKKLAVVAPSHFRLWNDRGEALAHVFEDAGDLQIVHIDPDDPASACPTDLPRRVADCDAIVTADIVRSDLPNLISSEMPWIAWITTPRVPPIESAGLRDHLILPDPTLATNAGWPSHRLHRATWPTVVSGSTDTAPQALAIVADTLSLETPEDLNDFSSHRVLWDTLRQEIANNPFIVGSDPQNYLLSRLKSVGFATDTFPMVRFLSQLIYPAIAQAIAKLLIDAKLPVKLYGAGWDKLEGFTDHFAGPVNNRDQFEAIVRQPVALVDVFTGIAAHPLRCVGRPVLSLANAREPFLRAAQKVLASPAVAGACPGPRLSPSLFREILSSLTG